MYNLDISEIAQDGLVQLKKSEPKAFDKAVALLKELQIHPRTGTGKPEFCKYEKKWSRRITQKHRLTYTINDIAVIVSVISAFGHYDNK